MSPFDREGFLTFAEELLRTSPDDETTQRTATNRAYYALFNVAKAQLVQEGVSVPPRASAHDLVWRTYQSAPRGVRRKIAQTGFRLLSLRHFADYEASYPGVARDAATSVHRARQAIDEIRNLNKTRVWRFPSTMIAFRPRLAERRGLSGDVGKRPPVLR